MGQLVGWSDGWSARHHFSPEEELQLPTFLGPVGTSFVRNDGLMTTVKFIYLHEAVGICIVYSGQRLLTTFIVCCLPARTVVTDENFVLYC